MDDTQAVARWLRDQIEVHLGHEVRFQARLDLPGAPWAIYHAETGEPLSVASTPREAARKLGVPVPREKPRINERWFFERGCRCA